MERIALDDPRKQIHDQTEPEADLATRARLHLLSFSHLSALERNRLAQQTTIDEGWQLWPPGGFQFEDGSVLWPSGSSWTSLSPTEAHAHLDAQRKQPLEVRLFHAFLGGDRREKHSVTEARFEFHETPERWRLVVEYEAYTGSPLYGFEADSFLELLGLNLWNLRVDTPRPDQRWRIEMIALHPDWQELSKVSSRLD